MPESADRENAPKATTALTSHLDPPSKQQPVAANTTTSPPGARLSRMPSVVEFEQHIVGSHTPKIVPPLWNLSAVPAQVTYHLQGEAFTLTSATSAPLEPSQSMAGPAVAQHLQNSPHIVFSPTQSGVNSGRLVATVQFQDGAIESAIVLLRGRGRAANELPSDEPIPADKAKLEAEEKQRKEDAENYEKIKDTAVTQDQHADDGTANVAAGNLNTNRTNGLSAGEKAIRGYRAQVKVESDILWTLLDIGLGMTTAGIAAHFAKNIAPKLIHGAKEVSFQNPLENVPELSAFTADFFKEGMKRGGKEAFAAVKPAAKHQTNDTSETQRIDEVVTIGARALANIHGENGKLIIEHSKTMQARLSASPDKKTASAAASMFRKAVATQFEETAKTAEFAQEQHLVEQWIATVAQLSNGTQTTEQDQKKLTGTNMNKAHSNPLSGGPSAITGILDVVVDETSGAIKSSRLFGVTQRATELVAGVPLHQLHIPLRIRVGDRDVNPTIITRDEMGRIRVTMQSAIGSTEDPDITERWLPFAHQVLLQSATNIEHNAKERT